MNSTIVWGTIADAVGIVVNRSEELEELPGGGVRVERRTRVEHEPASSYAGFHVWPMEMRWQHSEPVGWIRALRRAHGNLYAVGQTELEPDELRALAGEDGLRWSTGTNTRYGQPLRIVEISLTREAATNGLPAVSWHKRDVVRGDPPSWVTAELERAEKVEHRSRGELRVHEVEPVVDAAVEYEQLGRDLARFPLARLPGGYEHRRGEDYERPEIEIRPGGRIISVAGRPVDRGV